MSSECSCLVEKVTDVSSAMRTVHLSTIRGAIFSEEDSGSRGPRKRWA